MKKSGRWCTVECPGCGMMVHYTYSTDDGHVCKRCARRKKWKAVQMSVAFVLSDFGEFLDAVAPPFARAYFEKRLNKREPGDFNAIRFPLPDLIEFLDGLNAIDGSDLHYGDGAVLDGERILIRCLEGV